MADPRRAKLAIIDPHTDLPVDLAKSAVVVGLMIAGIVLRFEPMPTKMAGAAFIFVSVLLLVIWGKGLDRRRERRERALRAKLGDRPYPIRGYVDWLVADRPVTAVKLKRDIDHASLDSVTPGATWSDARTAIVAIPPKSLGNGLVGGDDAALVELLDRLAPIADHVDEIELRNE